MPSSLARLPAQARVILYARVSKDQHEGRSVAQQLKIGRRVADDRDWEVVGEFSDNDRSASQYAKGAREDWPKVEALIQEGGADVLWLWELSRGTRDRVVWAHLVAACQEHRMWIGLDEDLWDTTNPDHMKYLDSLMVDAIHEAGKTRKRIHRDQMDAAEAGRPHGKLHFAYRREYDPDTGRLLRQVPDEAKVKLLMEIRRRLREERHHPIKVAEWLNSEGVPTPRGRRRGERYTRRNGTQAVAQGWTMETIRQIFASTSLIGVRSHKGERKARGWEGILTEAEWEEMQQILSFSGPEWPRTAPRDGSARALLSAIATCDPCGSTMYLQCWGGSSRSPYYRCSRMFYGETQGHVCRAISRLDAQMREAVIERFADPDVLSAFTAGGPSSEEIESAVATVESLRSELEELYAEVEAGETSRAMAKADERRLKAQIAEWQRRARPVLVDPLVEELAAGSVDAVAAVWDGWSLEQQRAAVRLVTEEVRILRVGNVGRRKLSLEESMRIVWAGE